MAVPVTGVNEDRPHDMTWPALAGLGPYPGKDAQHDGILQTFQKYHKDLKGKHFQLLTLAGHFAFEKKLLSYYDKCTVVSCERNEEVWKQAYKKMPGRAVDRLQGQWLTAHGGLLYAHAASGKQDKKTGICPYNIYNLAIDLEDFLSRDWSPIRALDSEFRDEWRQTFMQYSAVWLDLMSTVTNKAVPAIMQALPSVLDRSRKRIPFAITLYPLRDKSFAFHCMQEAYDGTLWEKRVQQCLDYVDRIPGWEFELLKTWNHGHPAAKGKLSAGTITGLFHTRPF